jgi:hypothetical protein
MTDNERISRMDEKLDKLIDAFHLHALESVEVRTHVSLLKKIVYGAVGLSLTSLCVAAIALVVKS